MNSQKLILPVVFLLLASLACSVNLNLPETSLKTGETITEPISVPVPDARDIDLGIVIGAGELKINPGAQGGLVIGTITYNVPDFKPEIATEGGQVELSQGNLEMNGIPSFESDIKNEWNLALSNQPMTLRIKAGAYKGEFELGGLSLENLYIEDGASNVDLAFSTLNNVEMGILDYSTGASNVSLSGLANANFSAMLFKSGLGNYTLDFSGDLQQDASVSIDSGLSNVRLIVPEGVRAKINVESGITNVTSSGDWTKSGNNYTQDGNGPILNIQVDIGAGKLEITNR